MLLIYHQFLIMYWGCCSLVVWTHSHALQARVYTQGLFDISSVPDYVLNSPLLFGVDSQLSSNRCIVYSRYHAVSSPDELLKGVPRLIRGMGCLSSIHNMNKVSDFLPSFVSKIVWHSAAIYRWSIVIWLFQITDPPLNMSYNVCSEYRVGSALSCRIRHNVMSFDCWGKCVCFVT